MNAEIIDEWCRRYQAALGKHLKQGPRASLFPALGLGRQALALGLATLDIVRCHRQSLKTVVPSDEGVSGRLSKGSSTTRQGILDRANVFFDRTLTSAGKTHRAVPLAEFRVKQMTRAQRQRMATASDPTQRIVKNIAPSLLAINVRLLSLNAEARSSTQALKNKIASTQRLVAKSFRSVRRFARELASHPEARARRVVRHDAPTRRGTPLPASPTSIANGSFPVIAMAASVGGLKALSVILGGLPADFPAAIAIVMHLSPDHKSILAEILSSRTHLTVKQAHTGDILCRASVFVAPPNHHLFVAKGGRLKLSSSAAEKVHHARPSAEPLFVSVAEVYKKNAIAVVLTGGDGDGSFGVQIVKDKGGMVIAQDRPTSEDFSMPETSIETGDVDFILPLSEIAPKLMELVGARQDRSFVLR